MKEKEKEIKDGLEPAPALNQAEISSERQRSQRAFGVALAVSMVVFVVVGVGWPKWRHWPVHVEVRCGTRVLNDYWTTNYVPGRVYINDPTNGGFYYNPECVR